VLASSGQLPRKERAQAQWQLKLYGFRPSPQSRFLYGILPRIPAMGMIFTRDANVPNASAGATAANNTGNPPGRGAGRVPKRCGGKSKLNSRQQTPQSCWVESG
jgi:hypothetical protein